MKINEQLYKLCTILVKRGIPASEVSEMLGKSKSWLYEFFYRKDPERLTINTKMIQSLNKMGYDIQIVKLKGESDEQKRVEETEAAG